MHIVTVGWLPEKPPLWKGETVSIVSGVVLDLSLCSFAFTPRPNRKINPTLHTTCDTAFKPGYTLQFSATSNKRSLPRENYDDIFGLGSIRWSYVTLRDRFKDGHCHGNQRWPAIKFWQCQKFGKTISQCDCCCNLSQLTRHNKRHWWRFILVHWCWLLCHTQGYGIHLQIKCVQIKWFRYKTQNLVWSNVSCVMSYQHSLNMLIGHYLGHSELCDTQTANPLEGIYVCNYVL